MLHFPSPVKFHGAVGPGQHNDQSDVRALEQVL